MVNYTPRTWVSGETVTAAEMNTEIRDPWTGIQAAWTAFTPTLGAASVNPTGTIYTGSGYVQVGKWVTFRTQITLGAGTGTGAYAITLPVTPKAGLQQVIHGVIADTGTGWYDAKLITTGSSIATLLCESNTAGNPLRSVTPTVPMTFAAGDIIIIEGTYEAA